MSSDMIVTDKLLSVFRDYAAHLTQRSSRLGRHESGKLGDTFCHFGTRLRCHNRAIIQRLFSIS
jgi:hypothetical protein